MSSSEQNVFVAQIARWMLELFTHRYSHIGSLTSRNPIVSGTDGNVTVGPIVRRPFYDDGRSQFPLDRGPYTTAREYYLACAQREIECARALFVQGASPAYQRDLEETRLMVERCVGLLSELVARCEGLDEDDPELAPFALDIHDVGLRNILVSPEDHSKIVSAVEDLFGLKKC